LAISPLHSALPSILKGLVQFKLLLDSLINVSAHFLPRFGNCFLVTRVVVLIVLDPEQVAIPPDWQDLDQLLLEWELPVFVEVKGDFFELSFIRWGRSLILLIRLALNTLVSLILDFDWICLFC